MNQNLRLVVGQALFGLMFVLFCAGASWAQSDAAKLYKSKCAMCHANDGSGNTPAGKKLGARDLNSPEVQSESDAQLIEVLKRGKSKMPAYGKTLKEDEIKGLVAYIRELAKKK